VVFTVSVCDALDAALCDERTVSQDYAAVLNIDVTSSCQATEVVTESSDEQVVVSCTATNRAPIPVEVRLLGNGGEQLTDDHRTLASGETGTLRLILVNGTEPANLSGPWSLTALNAVDERALDGGTYVATRTTPENESTGSTAGTDGASSGDEGGSSIVLVLVGLAVVGAAGAVLMRRRGDEDLKEAAPVSLEGHLHLDEASEATATAMVHENDASTESTPQTVDAAAEATEPSPAAATSGPSIDTPATSVDDHGYEWYSTHEGHWYRATGSNEPWLPYEA